MDFLDPLKIDDGDNSHQQVHILGDIVGLADHPAMEAFVEKQISIRCQRPPGGKGTGFVAGLHQLTIFIMNILTELPVTGMAVVVK